MVHSTFSRISTYEESLTKRLRMHSSILESKAPCSGWAEAQEGPTAGSVGARKKIKRFMGLSMRRIPCRYFLGFRGPTVSPRGDAACSVLGGEKEGSTRCGRALMTWIKLVSSSRTTARNRVSWPTTDEKYYARNSSVNRPSCVLARVISAPSAGARDRRDRVGLSIRMLSRSTLSKMLSSVALCYARIPGKCIM